MAAHVTVQEEADMLSSRTEAPMPTAPLAPIFIQRAPR